MNNEELIKENLSLRNEIETLKEKLKNYTAPKRSKKFYETHKEEISFIGNYLSKDFIGNYLSKDCDIYWISRKLYLSTLNSNKSYKIKI